MTRQEKAEAILGYILLAIADDDAPEIAFGPDFGYGSATISIGNAHTHVGICDTSCSKDERFTIFVDGLHAQLMERRGLSWCATDPGQQ